MFIKSEKESIMDSKEAVYVSLIQLRNGVCSNYLNTVANLAKTKTNLLTHVNIDELEGEVRLLSEKVVALKACTQTERLRAADRKRDKRLSAIGYLLRGLAIYEDENQDDAKALKVVVDSYDLAKVRKASYGDETAKIKSIITRVNSEPNLEKMNKFPFLSDWFTALEEDNQAFEAIMNEKAAEIDPDHTSTKEQIAKIIPLYREFIKAVNAHAYIGTDPEFAEFIEEHNAQVVVQNLD